MVERLFAFVVASTDAGTALAADGINFVNEDQARAVLLGLLEQIADAAGTHANEHLNELRTRKGEEGNARFTGNGLGQKGFAGAGRADQQKAAGNLSTNGGESLGLLQEGDHFLEFLLGFGDAGHVIEHDAGLRFHHEAGFALAELHGLARAARHVAVAAGQEDQGTDQQQREGQIAQHAEGRRCCAGRMNIKADAFGLQRVDQLRGQTRKVNAQALNAVVEVGIDGFDHSVAATVVDINGCHATGLDVIEEAAVAHPCHRSIAGSDGGAIAVLAEAVDASVAHHLPADQQHDADWQQPEGKKAPALIHELKKFVNECKGVGLISEA